MDAESVAAKTRAAVRRGNPWRKMSAARTILHARGAGQTFARPTAPVRFRIEIREKSCFNVSREGLRETVHKFSNFRGFCLYRSGSVCYVAKAGKNLIELR